MGVVDSSTVLSVPVRIKIENNVKALKELKTGLQDTFTGANISGNLEKQLTKVFNQIESKVLKIDSLMGSELFTQGDLKKVDTLYGSIVESMGQIYQLIQRASPGNLGLDLTEIEEADKKIREILENIKQTKNISVGSFLGKDSKVLKEFSETAKKTGFDSGKSLTQNINSMDSAIGRITAKIAEIGPAAEDARRKLEPLLAGQDIVKARTADQITSIKGTGKGRKAADVLEEYKQLIGQQITESGDFVDGGSSFSRVIAGWLDFSPEEVDQLMQKPAKEIVQSLQEAIDTQAKKNPMYGFGTGKLRENALKYASQDKKLTEEQYKNLLTKYQGSLGELDDTITELMVPINNLEEAEQLLTRIREQLDELRRLRKEYEDQVDRDNRDALEAARKEKAEAVDRAKAPQIAIAKEHYDQGKARRLEIGAELAGEKARAQAAQEAERFSDNLRQSISHWMSAQQIINYIRDGVRKAWQDIQGLDKAMTNIAVVTDMSVSDLWGKINEYMSVAQQYGVTTQGVYEVSQLYYQQGLNANEVMAATTETLKMARIAGMQYAEAADGMTVA